MQKGSFVVVVQHNARIQNCSTDNQQGKQTVVNTVHCVLWLNKLCYSCVQDCTVF